MGKLRKSRPFTLFLTLVLLTGMSLALANPRQHLESKFDSPSQNPLVNSFFEPPRERNYKTDMELAVERYLARKAEEARRAEEARTAEEAKEREITKTSSKIIGKTGPKASGQKASARTVQSTVTDPIAMKQAQANRILASLIAKYPILQGSTVHIRPCPNGWQGCCWYKRGEIWVDPNHRASLSDIIQHECMHIIDWREDGDIDHNDYWE